MNAQRARVLVVEDDQALGRVVVDLLRQGGFRADHVGTAELGHRIVTVIGQDSLVEGIGLFLARTGHGRGLAGVGHELVEQQATQRLRAARIPRKQGPFDRLRQVRERKDRADRVGHIGREPDALCGGDIAGRVGGAHRLTSPTIPGVP